MSKAKTGPNYEAWNISEKDFPKNGSIEEQIKFLIGYGVLAPSTHNTQPWLFEVQQNELTILPNYELRLPAADPGNSGLMIAIGACAENITQAASYFGLNTSITHAKDRVLIKFSSGNTRKNVSLKAITARYSDKMPYLNKDLSREIIQSLNSFQDEDFGIKIVDGTTLKKEVTSVHIEAAVATAQDNKFGLELSEWMRPNQTKSTNGMPGFTRGSSSLQAIAAQKLFSKKPEILRKIAPKDESLLDQSSGFVIFYCKKDTFSETKLGMFIEKVWLQITTDGLVAHPFAASIYHNKSREKLRKLLGLKTNPAFFLRIGYSSTNAYHTPRETMTINKMQSLTKVNEVIGDGIESHSIKVGKYDINYVTLGMGDPLFLIHGANIGYPQWHLNLAQLAKHFKVIAIDLPGAGGSTHINFRKSDFEKDFLEVVDKLIIKLGLKNITLVGSSFGGWIALKLASQRRSYIKNVIVANPIGFTQYMPPKFRPISIPALAFIASKTALRPSRDNKNLEKFMRDVFYDKNTYLDPAFVDYFYELSKTSHNVRFISRLAHFSGMRKELFLGDVLRQIEVPTLVIWGKEDELMPYWSVKDNFKLVPNVEVKTFEKIGHMPPVEMPEVFNKTVIEYLKK